MTVVLGVLTLIGSLTGCSRGDDECKADPLKLCNLPDGVEIQVYAFGITESLPPRTESLLLERVSFDPGSFEPLQRANGPILLYVESGTLSIIDELNLSVEISGGGVQFFEDGAHFEIRNNSDRAATLLRLRLLISYEPSATPLAPAVYGQASSAILPTEIVLVVPFANGQKAPAVLFFAQGRWGPNAVLDDHVFSGPLGLYITEGTLVVSGPSGLASPQTAQQGPIAFHAFSRNRQVNETGESVTAQLIGVAYQGENLVKYCKKNGSCPDS